MPASAKRPVPVLIALMAGYVGIYLCRKNLAVAVPLLREAFGASRAEVGRVASLGTLAYALGKLVLGPLVDRLGGRRGFLLALAGVALFGAASAASPGLGLLGVLYALNRFSGAAGWPAMMKLVPTWTRPERVATVVALLSLAFVLGGSAATLFAGAVLEHGGGWRAVMGMPSLVLLAIAAGCALVVRTGPREQAEPGRVRASPIGDLFRRPQFLLVCGLSFTLTLVRETFNTWSVDFLTSVESGAPSVARAALESITFDLAGALGIVLMGLAYDRAPARTRRWLVAGVLVALAALMAGLPRAAALHPASATWLIGAVGLLVYGPYSLLAGALAIESGGADRAATASGAIDAVGYLGGVLAGEGVGRILDAGRYPLAFEGLAAITVVSALLALGLRPAGAAQASIS